LLIIKSNISLNINFYIMAIPSRQIGWSTTDNLLWEISKQLEALIGQVGAVARNTQTTTTTTTTAAP
jgi:hypothetical protein